MSIEAQDTGVRTSNDLSEAVALSDIWHVIAKALLRVVQRPRPWVLYSLLSLLPALVLAPLMALPLLEWSRSPLFRRALTERSLDLFLDFASSFAESTRPLSSTGIAVLLFPLAWVFVRLLWTWFRGGALHTYAAPSKPERNAFRHACRHWFASFLLIEGLGSLLRIFLGATGVGVVAALAQLSSVLGWIIGIPAVLLLGLLGLWIELAHAALVATDTRHVLKGLREAARVLFRHPLPLLALVGVGLIAQGGLLLTHRWLQGAIPVPWWALTFLVAQVYAAARLGVRLARQAGEVAFIRFSQNR